MSASPFFSHRDHLEATFLKRAPKQFIGGAWLESAGDGAIEVINPARASVAAGSAIDADRAELGDLSFGGFKRSGLGRELGREGVEAYTETKSVGINF